MLATHPAAKNIRLLLLDVDGVLTSGDIIYTDAGEEIKHFSAKDGLGIRMLIDNGINVGIVTARTSKVLLHRCSNLGINMIFDGVKNKGDVLPEVTASTGLAPNQIAFMGDDLPDLSLLAKVGLSLTVADGAREVAARVNVTTSKPGGKGAVREACELILRSQNLWAKALSRFEE